MSCEASLRWDPRAARVTISCARTLGANSLCILTPNSEGTVAAGERRDLQVCKKRPFLIGTCARRSWICCLRIYVGSLATLGCGKGVSNVFSIVFQACTLRSHRPPRASGIAVRGLSRYHVGIARASLRIFQAPGAPTDIHA